MLNSKKTAAVLVLAAILAAGCGKNPFGLGEAGGLNIFAKVAKAMQKPSAINDEKNNQDNTKGVITEGQAAKMRMAKAASGGAVQPSWLDSNYVEYIGGDTLAYIEQVTNKPSEEDAEKWVTGEGKVVFRYSGSVIGIHLGILDPAKITNICTWSFTGKELKTWNSELCSLKLAITWSSSGITDLKPGRTVAWGKNISATDDLGKGDTTRFSLDSLVEETHSQYGSGTFYDAHTGSDNSGDSKSFSYTIQVIHKNTLDSTQPYLRYQDNEGIVNFYLPWGKTGAVDSLYFTIHFLPNYEREGTIKKNGPEGATLVSFTKNDKTGAGTVTYRNENGEVVDTE